MCRGLFRVATTRNVGQDLATFGDVADMSPTCRRHVELSQSIPFTENFFWHQFVLPNVIEHPYPVDNLIRCVKVGFHQEDGTEFGN